RRPGSPPPRRPPRRAAPRRPPPAWTGWRRASAPRRRPRQGRSPPAGFGAEAGPGDEPRLPFRVGKDLAGVQVVSGGERPRDARHGVEVVGAVDPGHERVLL